MALCQLGMKRIALQVSRSSFICGQCLRKQDLISRPVQSKLRWLTQTSSRRFITTEAPRTQPGQNLGGDQQSSSKAEPNASSKTSHGESRSSSFPEVNSKAVGYWLLGSAASVFGIVIFGGLTRLTESG
jgi:cytochrome c oxidase assembly protein subunit 15